MSGNIRQLEEIACSLVEIKQLIKTLSTKNQDKKWYTVQEFASRVGRESYTVREWCRMGRIRAQKKQSGRGSCESWVIRRQELDRYERLGLLRPNPKTKKAQTKLGGKQEC